MYITKNTHYILSDVVVSMPTVCIIFGNSIILSNNNLQFCVHLMSMIQLAKSR